MDRRWRHTLRVLSRTESGCHSCCAGCDGHRRRVTARYGVHSSVGPQHRHTPVASPHPARRRHTPCCGRSPAPRSRSATVKRSDRTGIPTPHHQDPFVSLAVSAELGADREVAVLHELRGSVALDHRGTGRSRTGRESASLGRRTSRATGSSSGKTVLCQAASSQAAASSVTLSGCAARRARRPPRDTRALPHRVRDAHPPRPLPGGRPDAGRA